MFNFFRKKKDIQIEAVSIEQVCPTITYNFQITRFGKHNLIDTLIIFFQGKYRNGSIGRPDAGFMNGVIKLGIEVWEPTSVIIDLTNLEYNWGNNIESIYGVAKKKKAAIVVGEKCRKGLSTLAFGIDTNKDIVDNEFFFDNLKSALLKVKQTS